MEKQRGLTLLEMLVSILILTTVLALTSSSYSYYIGQLNSKKSAFEHSLNKTKLAQAWQSQLSSAFAYFIPVAPNTNKIWFKGDASSVSWVASTSLQQPGVSSLAWFGLRGKKLVYCEQTLLDKLFVSAEINIDALCEHYELEIDEVSSLVLEYYSWPSLLARQSEQSGNAPAAINTSQRKWFKKVDAFETAILPEWIKVVISYEGAEREYWLRLENNDRERLGIFFNESVG